MKTKEMLDRDFFSIEESEEGKIIHIHGYMYDAGDSVTDNEDETYRKVDIGGLFIPIAEFVRDFAENEDYINDLQCECAQYIDDLTEEGVRCIFEDYYGVDFTELNYSEITEETPCGHYVTRC